MNKTEIQETLNTFDNTEQNVFMCIDGFSNFLDIYKIYRVVQF